MLSWLSVWSEVQTCIQPSWCHCHSLSLASVKSRLVLPFWYRLTWVVLDKGSFNGRVYVCVFLNVWCLLNIHAGACDTVTQALQADTAMKTLMNVWWTPHSVWMVQCAPTQTAHFSVHVPMDTSAATVHWTTSAMVTVTTAVARAVVVPLSARMTLQCTYAAAIMAGRATVVNKLWSVTICWFASLL